MGKITAIEPQRRPGRYNVLVDGAFAFAVSEQVLADLRLSVGNELDEQRAAEASQAEDDHKALTAALRLLESRPRSESEIRARLKTHGYSSQTGESIVGKLRGYGLVNDVEFTAAWIDSRSRTQPGGKRKLQFELHQKGVAQETVDEAVGAITEEEEIALAKKALAKRPFRESNDPKERRAAYTRDAGYLARRGFSWTIAKAALSERYAAASAEAED